LAAVRALIDDEPPAFQAQGMVMIQLGIPLVEAMARLRAHAFAQDRALAEVADDPPWRGADRAVAERAEQLITRW
jgi:hypothetical protein